MGFFRTGCLHTGTFGGLFKLVTARFTGEENPQAHITVLPPRPLKAGVDLVSCEAQAILSGFSPFSVELSEVKVFPETNILYLDIASGNDALHHLHDALNIGLLAHEENFDFLPHLTLRCCSVEPAHQGARGGETSLGQTPGKNKV